MNVLESAFGQRFVHHLENRMDLARSPITMVWWTRLLATTFVFAMLSSPATATTFWVDGNYGPGGSGTQASPYDEIHEAIYYAGPGDTVKIRGGQSYLEQVIILDKYGTSSNPIVIEGYEGVANEGFPEINGGYVLPDEWHGWGNVYLPNNTYLGLLSIENAAHLTVRNLKVAASKYSGISVMWTDENKTITNNITIEDCTVENIRQYGIFVGAISRPDGHYGNRMLMSSPLHNVTVRNNTLNEICTEWNPTPPFDKAAGECMRIRHADQVYVYGNVLKQFHKEGLNTAGAVTNTYVYDNHIGTTHAAYGVGRRTCIYADASDSPANSMGNIHFYQNFLHGHGRGITCQSERGGDFDGVYVYNNIITNEGLGFSMSEDVRSGSTQGNMRNVWVYNNAFLQPARTTGTNEQFVVQVIQETDFSKVAGFEFKNNLVAREYKANRRLFDITRKDYLGDVNANGVVDAPDWAHVAMTISASNPNASFTMSNNSYWNNVSGGATGIQGDNTITSDPVLISIALNIAGVLENPAVYPDIVSSPMIEGGVNVSHVSADFINTTRTTPFDVGAFESSY